MWSQCIGVKESESFMQESISEADLGILIRGVQTYPWLKLSSLGNNSYSFLSFICFTVNLRKI